MERRTPVSMCVSAGRGEVAQVSNLLYRRASSLRAVRLVVRALAVGSLPIRNRRYNRLETCATLNTHTVLRGGGHTLAQNWFIALYHKRPGFCKEGALNPAGVARSRVGPPLERINPCGGAA